MSDKVYLNRRWQYFDSFSEYMTNSKGKKGVLVDLPHTVAISSFNYFDESIYRKDCCYQKSFIAPNKWAGQTVNIVFEGIANEACVYINGNMLKSHVCGYTAFSVDISHYIKLGEENLISIRVLTNKNHFWGDPDLDDIIYGGIYREVYFEIKRPAHFKEVYYNPSLMEKVTIPRRSKDSLSTLPIPGIIHSTCYISEEAVNLARIHRLVVRQSLDGKVLLEQPVAGITNDESGMKFILTSAPLMIHIWDVVCPNTYTVTTELVLDNIVQDSHTAIIGFRHSEFKADGYYLNDRKLLIRGLDRHQSFPFVGYAMPESMQRYDAQILKNELGVNAVRTSYYPQSQYFVDECDKIGLLVFMPLPAYHNNEDVESRDLATDIASDIILQYRNHPSVIAWYDEQSNASMESIIQKLDPSRLVNNIEMWSDSKSCSLNNGDNELLRKNHMLYHASYLNDASAKDNIAGSLGQIMADFNTNRAYGYSDGICYKGVMDMYRNPKLAAFVYGALGCDDTVLELSSSMELGECNDGIKSYIITNADSVRMYKNDVLLKEYTSKDSSFTRLEHGPILVTDLIGEELINKETDISGGRARYITDLINEAAVSGQDIVTVGEKLGLKGKLYSVDSGLLKRCYDKYISNNMPNTYRLDAVVNGEVVKTITKKQFEHPKMVCTISHTLLAESHTYDVAEIRIAVKDQDGNHLYYYNEPYTIESSGPIAVIGSKQLSFRGGFGGVYIRSLGDSDEAEVKISSPHLSPVTISFQCLAEV